MPSKPQSPRKKSKKPITGANISWESTEPKKEPSKFSKQRSYYSLIGLFFLFLFFLYVFVDDRPTISSTQPKPQANAPKSAPKEFTFQHAHLLNSTDLQNTIKTINEDENIDRLVVVIFEDSNREANGQPTKVPLFKKFDGIAKAMPKKQFFKRYNDEDLPLIILFDCSNPNDANAEPLCKQVVGANRPNVIIFRKGQQQPRVLPSEHKSDHQIMAYLHSLMQPAVKYLEERDNAEEFVADDSEMNVVLFGDDKTGNFEKIADLLRDYGRFAKTKNPSIAESFDATIPSLLIWRTFGMNPVVYPGNISDGQAIQHFIINQYLPVLGEFTPTTSRRYLKRSLPIVWIAYADNDDFIKEVLSVTETIANRYVGQLSFVQLDTKANPQIAKNFGIEDTSSKEEKDKDEDSDDDNKNENSRLPQVFIMNQVAEIREHINPDNVAESIQKVVEEYFHKVRLARGEIMSEIDDVGPNEISADEFEEDDEEGEMSEDYNDEEDDDVSTDQKQET